MTLNAIGDVVCKQCNAELAPEPEAAPTALICPRGCGPLAAFGDVFECDRCGGLFLDHDKLGALVAAHRPKVEGERRTSIVQPPAPPIDPVTYLPCARCNVRMNRTVFGKSSGVIVDVCSTHGTWFDARELTASLAFVERGGIELVEKRERERKVEAERQAEIDARTKAFDLINRPMGPRGFDPDRYARNEALKDLLSVLLSL
jgi:Zn-finger nucleic acid-binding protein